jgi:aminoglycoside phosphotransferase family enzyme/predicted kinase
LIETHISWVFVAPPFVFKVKKAVDFGFVDFSTLEKRRHFCQRELELNRRLCPDVYLAVIPIYEGSRGFSFNDGDAEIVEYAVKMRELKPGWFLHELLMRNAVGEGEINRVIQRLRRFYESERPDPQIQKWGKPENLKISTDENFSQVEAFTGKTISPLALEVIRHFTDGFYAANNELFEDRVRQLRIRDCHGDLRLDHVHITPQATTIFDCLEFNDRLRLIDITNDIAFLAMDFDVAGHRELGDRFLQNMARELDDPGILRLADFYKCYRAFVRGKVESIQAIAGSAADREKHTECARRYFHFALRYATIGSGPMVLAVMGRIAVGKSTAARRLAAELDWPIFSSDEIRKTLAGLPLKTRTSPAARGRVYSEQMTKATYGTLFEKGLAAVRDGGGVVLDATFSTPSMRGVLLRGCAQAGVQLQFIELEADSETVRRRLKARADTASEVSDARLEDFENLNALYVPPSELAPDLIKVSATGAVSDAARAALLRLAGKQSVRLCNDAA